MRNELYTYGWMGEAFNKDEIKQILDFDLPWESGRMDRGEDAVGRSSSVAWLCDKPEFLWVFDRLITLMDNLNRNHLHLEWDRWLENIQLTRYSPDDHYTWHCDHGPGSAIHRKLSCTVFLNTDYEGGELELWADTEPETINAQVGKIVVFPCHVLHRVAPVTKGERLSLVAWGHGKRLQ